MFSDNLLIDHIHYAKITVAFIRTLNVLFFNFFPIFDLSLFNLLMFLLVLHGSLFFHLYFRVFLFHCLTHSCRILFTKYNSDDATSLLSNFQWYLTACIIKVTPKEFLEAIIISFPGLYFISLVLLTSTSVSRLPVSQFSVHAVLLPGSLEGPLLSP